MTAQPTARMPPLAPVAPHHMFYPSSEFASSTASGNDYWNIMPPTNIPECVRKSNSPTQKKAAPPPKEDGGFTFITAGKPADFRSKKAMTQVRKKAMDSYLKTDKSKDSASRSSAERSNSVVSGASPVSMVTDHHTVDASQAFAQPHRDIQAPRSKKPLPSRRFAQAAPGRDVASSSSSNQIAKRMVLLPSAPLVEPSRTGVVLDFDIHEIPMLRSLGMPLDPFGTMFQSSNNHVSVEHLKWDCSRHFGTRGLGKHWIPFCLDHAHTFLSTICLAAAHNDVLQEKTSESLETAALRQDIVMMVGENLLNSTKSVADHNIIAVSQLIICEVISRKETDLAFHEAGMEAMIRQRGGLSRLGANGYLASAVTWVHLASAALRESKPRPMYLEFGKANLESDYPVTATLPESPIFCPREALFTIERSDNCNQRTRDLIKDIRTMTDLFLKETKQGQGHSQLLMNLHTTVTNYPTAAQFSKTTILRDADWRYEAIRIAALVQATAIVRRLPLSRSLVFAATTTRNPSFLDTNSIASRSNESIFSTMENQQITPVTDHTASPSFSMVDTSPGVDASCYPFDAQSLTSPPTQVSPPAHRPSVASAYSTTSDIMYFPPPPAAPPTGPTALLRSLRDALEKSNLSNCWGDMAGVLLWIGLIMGAASHTSESKVLSRYFSATTMRAGIILCFDHPKAMHATMLKMTELVDTLASSGTVAPAADVAIVHKRRRN